MKSIFHDSLRRRQLGLALGLAAALALPACGGGGGSDSSDVAGGVGSGGTGSFASGSISGFGSVIVNHVHYDESGAAIRSENGDALNRDQLRLGMVVEIQGSEASTAANGRLEANAEQIVLRSEIEGPVDAINTSDGTVTVLGQTVRTDARTVFDDELIGALASLRVGDVLEVYGFQDAAGNYLASRIEREDDPVSHYKVRGTVQALNTGSYRFQVGAVNVDYAALPTLALQDGVQVRVRLDPNSGRAGNLWSATKVELEASPIDAAAPGNAQLQVELEGIVTAWTSPQSFSVNGVAVDASAVAYIPPGLALGSRVEVDGSYAQAVLKATEVELDDAQRQGDASFELEGPVENLNLGAQTFSIRGVSVRYALARFKDGSASQLANGSVVDIEARLDADGSTLVATEIEFDDDASTPDQDFELDGRITSLNTADKRFVLRGYTVEYANARFDEGVEANLAVGRRVEVEGSLQADGNTVTAREIEFDDGDD